MLTTSRAAATVAVSTPPESARVPARLFFADHLRTTLSVLVVQHHQDAAFRRDWLRTIPDAMGTAGFLAALLGVPLSFVVAALARRLPFAAGVL